MSIKTLFTDIAVAIKEKNTDVVTVTPTNMPQAIRDIETGGGVPTLMQYLYTGTEQTFTAPTDGLYTFLLYGASGGAGSFGVGGKGGYVRGSINLNANDTIYIQVGGAGTGGTSSSAGYNGGGSGENKGYERSGGGGATHIATASGLLTDVNIANVLMVAGGGGGAANFSATAGNGGDGGLPGANGTNPGFGAIGYGGTLTGGGAGTDAGYYGHGGNANTTSTSYGGSGGGGGIYGGGASEYVSGAGGGCSYISDLCINTENTTGTNDGDGYVFVLY